MAKAEEYVVGIDVGSSKVAVLIAKRDGRGGLEVAGRGQAPNRGTRRGNIGSTTRCTTSLVAHSRGPRPASSAANTATVGGRCSGRGSSARSTLRASTLGTGKPSRSMRSSGGTGAPGGRSSGRPARSSHSITPAVQTSDVS